MYPWFCVVLSLSLNQSKCDIVSFNVCLHFPKRQTIDSSILKESAHDNYKCD